MGDPPVEPRRHSARDYAALLRLGDHQDGLHVHDAESTVEGAVEERLARVQCEDSAAKVARILAIGRDTAPRLREPWKSGDHGDLLYDERGLPR